MYRAPLRPSPVVWFAIKKETGSKLFGTTFAPRKPGDSRSLG